jgi:hypothetical protein
MIPISIEISKRTGRRNKYEAGIYLVINPGSNLYLYCSIVITGLFYSGRYILSLLKRTP